MAVGSYLSLSLLDECQARVFNPGFFFNQVVLNVQLVLIAASKIKLALMVAVKTDEQTPIRELIPFGQTFDFFWFRSAPHP